MKSDLCAYCHAPIVWLASPLGAPVPVNPEPVSGELLTSTFSAWVVSRSGRLRSAHDLGETPSEVLLSHKCEAYLEATRSHSPTPLSDFLEPMLTETRANELLEEAKKKSRRHTPRTISSEVLSVE